MTSRDRYLQQFVLRRRDASFSTIAASQPFALLNVFHHSQISGLSFSLTQNRSNGTFAPSYPDALLNELPSSFDQLACVFQ
jgi:hypothetical protein